MEAGPHRKEEMATEDVRSWVQQVAAYRQGHIKSIVITGGEPFYNRALLRETLDCAAYSRLVAVVITNAFWATSLPTAIDVLRNLPQIRMLTVSTDVHHQRFIPIENAKNALLAARELGMVYGVGVCTEDETDPEYLRMLSLLQQIIEKDKISTVITFPAG
jgi:MoaA/NifB/PqqE/SkfB family radical SAM enzyme